MQTIQIKLASAAGGVDNGVMDDCRDDVFALIGQAETESDASDVRAGVVAAAAAAFSLGDG